MSDCLVGEMAIGEVIVGVVTEIEI